MGQTQNKQFFLAEMTKADHKLSKTFILSKYHMFWLSYACFSLLQWCFVTKKGHFQLLNSCEGGFIKNRTNINKTSKCIIKRKNTTSIRNWKIAINLNSQKCKARFKQAKSTNYLSVRNTHCTKRLGNWFPRKLILIPLTTFFGNFATFFGNNLLLLQHFLTRKLLRDKVILPSC